MWPSTVAAAALCGAAPVPTDSKVSSLVHMRLKYRGAGAFGAQAVMILLGD